MNQPAPLTQLFMQEWEFGGVRAPAVVWGITVGAALIALAGSVWVYQYSRSSQEV